MYHFVFASRTDSTGANAHQRYFVWVPWLHARSRPCDAVRHDNVCGFFYTCLHFCIFAHFQTIRQNLNYTKLCYGPQTLGCRIVQATLVICHELFLFHDPGSSDALSFNLSFAKEKNKE